MSCFQKLGFFALGGCFTLLGIVAGSLTYVEAENTDLGKINIFDTISCKRLVINDNENVPRMLLDGTPSLSMTDSSGDMQFILSVQPHLPTIIIGNLEEIYTEIDNTGVSTKIDGEIISQ